MTTMILWTFLFVHVVCSNCTHSVSLTWQTSNGAVGYNIYRGTVSGGPYSLLNEDLIANPEYVDRTVANNSTYFYVATAVDSEGDESGYSNEAEAVIP